MAKQLYNHAFQMAFEVISNQEDGNNITEREVLAGLAQRITNFLKNPTETLQACESYDAYECNPNCKICERNIQNMDNAHSYKKGYVCGDCWEDRMHDE